MTVRSLIACLLVAGVCFTAAWRATGPQSPPDRAARPLRFSVGHLDLGEGLPGEGLPGEELPGTFEVVNETAGEMEFRLGRSCSCTSLSPEQGRIPPNGRAVIRTTLRLPTASGGRATSHVTLQVGDASEPVDVIDFEASCPRLFNLSALRVRFESTADDRMASPEVASVRIERRGITFAGVANPVDNAIIPTIGEGGRKGTRTAAAVGNGGS